jgi:hypothetical protein
LFFRRQVAEEVIQIHVAGHRIFQPRFCAADFPGARQEDEHVSRRLSGQGVLHLRRHGGLDPVLHGPIPVVDLHRIAAAFALNEGGVQQPRNGTRVKGCAHHEDAELRTKNLAGLEREGKAKIGLQVALVKLVE